MAPFSDDCAPKDDLAETSVLLALIRELRAQNAALVARVAELGLNSGKPASSDGLKKPARVGSLRERTGKKPGG